MVSKTEEGVVAKHLLIELLKTHSGGSREPTNSAAELSRLVIITSSYIYMYHIIHKPTTHTILFFFFLNQLSLSFCLVFPNVTAGNLGYPL